MILIQTRRFPRSSLVPLANNTLNRYFTKEEIEKHLMTTARGSPPLDVLIRTSGVKRLSDFLLWQVGSYFTPHLVDYSFDTLAVL